MSTTGIYRIFRGLKFEPDAEIGQKGAFFKGLKYFTVRSVAYGFFSIHHRI